MAAVLLWIPASLYDSSVSAVVSSYEGFSKDLRYLQKDVFFDICYKMYIKGKLDALAKQISDLQMFFRLLTVKDKRYQLHHCFQVLVDEKFNVLKQLTHSFRQHCEETKTSLKDINNAIEMGMELGGFLSDAGWFADSELVFISCFELCKLIQDEQHATRLCVDCYQQLLHVRNAFCKFSDAYSTYTESRRFLEDSNVVCNAAGLYAEYSNMFFERSNYLEAYEWSLEALKELSLCESATVIPRTIVTVLRQAAKACLLKRLLKRAGWLIKQAFHYAKKYFGNRHPVMAEFYSDYGYYLLNIDLISHSIKVYEAALETRQCIFGGTNLLVAISHEDLAYAVYVHDYCSGSFGDARQHAETAMQIKKSILPEDHLLLASAKRVKALILEEIAICNQDRNFKMLLLLESQELHTAALRLARETFGEINVQTAKHYGNLGRLYQSMQKYEDAKSMHLRAIAIKEQVLGSEDYEVALSVGHLASLYNYDMNEYRKAEVLYLRSISIGIKLFGEAFSALEYDYRGLLRIYSSIGDTNKVNKYREILCTWKMLRDQNAERENEFSPLMVDVDPSAVSNFYNDFFYA